MAPEDPAEAAFGYSALLQTTYAGSAAYARPLGGYGTVAAGFDYFSQAAQTAYNTLGTAVGSFTPNDFAVSFGYGRKLGRVLAGGAVKIIRSSIADASGTSAAVDAGVQVLDVTEAGDGAVDAGASISNLGPPIKVGSAASPLPFTGRAGFLWHTSPYVNSMLDVVCPVDESPYAALGIEAVLKQPSWAGALRVGYSSSRSSQQIDGLSGITAGAGLDFQRFRLDYAWAPFGDLGATNLVSVAFRF